MGWSVSIPKTWHRLRKIDKYDLRNCYYTYYYCRSKKRIICVPRGFEPTVTIKPILRDEKRVYKFRTSCEWSFSFIVDRDKLIEILKTQLQDESLFVDLDDFDDVDLEKYIE